MNIAKIVSISDWVNGRKNKLYNAVKVLGAAFIWSLFEVMGIFHSLSANKAWSFKDLELFYSGFRAHY